LLEVDMVYFHASACLATHIQIRSWNEPLHV
jgi:hypothetical protein